MPVESRTYGTPAPPPAARSALLSAEQRTAEDAADAKGDLEFSFYGARGAAGDVFLGAAGVVLCGLGTAALPAAGGAPGMV